MVDRNYRKRYIRRMNTSAPIPAVAEVRAKLGGLAHAECKALATRTGVPFTTLWKIRSGETSDPRLETVRAIWPDLSTKQDAAAA